MSESIINSDKMMEKWGKTVEELRRNLQAKYVEKDKNVITFAKAISNYRGTKICSDKFNFQVEGNKCGDCNSLSHLFKSGDIKFDKPFKIQAGKFEGKYIKVIQYTKGGVGNFDIITPKAEDVSKIAAILPSIELCSNQITKVFSYNLVVNSDVEIFHYISVATLLNYSLSHKDIDFKNRFLYVYICDNLNLVKYEPNLGVGSFTKILQSDGKLKEKTVKDIFIQLILYFYILGKNEYFFSHGSPDLSFLSFDSEGYKKTWAFGKKNLDVDSSVRLYIDPGNYSSMCYTEYNKSKYHIVPKYDTKKILSTIPINVSFSFIPVVGTQPPGVCIPGSLKNPCLPEYLEKRTVTYRIDHKSISFIRNSGILIFPSLDIYLFLTALLLNVDYFTVFMEIPVLKNILKSIIAPEQYDLFVGELMKAHKNGNVYSSDQIVSFISGMQLDFKCDIVKDILKSLLAEVPTL